jgi:hypothetical protein
MQCGDATAPRVRDGHHTVPSVALIPRGVCTPLAQGPTLQPATPVAAESEYRLTEDQRMSQHRKPAHRRKRSSARHRKPSAGINTTKVAVAAAGAVLVGGGVAQAVTPPLWLGEQQDALNNGAGAGHAATSTPSPVYTGSHRRDQGSQPIDLHLYHMSARSPASRSRTHRSAHPKSTPRQTPTSESTSTPTSTPTTTSDGYANPIRGVSGLIPERIDMGVDFGGSGPVYAVGDAVITNAQGNNAGWPCGGWITYQLTSGPAKGLSVYVAEDVTPTVAVGENVSSSTVIANMYSGGAGIETGWAMPDGSSAESQLAVAGGISGGGPFPTVVGLNFEKLLESLGVPAGYGSTDSGYGLLPPGYPTNWPAS